jgi:hypothetical protein
VLDLYALSGLEGLDPLAGMTDLEELYIGYTEVTDLEPLQGLTKMVRLDAPWNGLTDLSGLEGMTALEIVDLTGNELTDLSPLDGLVSLANITVSSNHIVDLSSLASLPNLERVGASGQKLSLEECAAGTWLTNPVIHLDRTRPRLSSNYSDGVSADNTQYLCRGIGQTSWTWKADVEINGVNVEFSGELQRYVRQASGDPPPPTSPPPGGGGDLGATGPQDGTAQRGILAGALIGVGLSLVLARRHRTRQQSS